MPKINITRGADAVKMQRSAVKAGQVFASKGRDGRLGTDYANIGHNGRYYSVNTKTGELSSNARGDREVTLTGRWEFKINRKPAPGVVRECRRSEVKSGEVFHVRGKDTLYAHMGAITRDMNGFLSVPLARTENHAVTRNGNSRVNVIGTFVMDVHPTN